MKSGKRRRGGRQGSREAQHAAGELAIAALAFIAREPERLGHFLAATGIGPESVRAAAREPGFLAGVLDYVAGDETLLLGFAEQSGIDPDDVGQAREALAGPRGDSGAA
jgi:uncharacterized protein DUF3572